jgi:hypothetical protein
LSYPEINETLMKFLSPIIAAVLLSPTIAFAVPWSYTYTLGANSSPFPAVSGGLGGESAVTANTLTSTSGTGSVPLFPTTATFSTSLAFSGNPAWTGAVVNSVNVVYSGTGAIYTLNGGGPAILVNGSNPVFTGSQSLGTFPFTLQVASTAGAGTITSITFSGDATPAGGGGSPVPEPQTVMGLAFLAMAGGYAGVRRLTRTKSQA